MPAPTNPRLFGGAQPMSQVGGRAPAQRPMMGGGGGMRPGMPQRPPQQPMSPQHLQAKELLLKSELLRVQAQKLMMGGGAGGRKPRGNGNGG